MDDRAMNSESGAVPGDDSDRISKLIQKGHRPGAGEGGGEISPPEIPQVLGGIHILHQGQQGNSSLCGT